MSDPLLALKTAFYTALDAALSVPVFDHVPQGQDYPYVCLDTFTVSNAEFLNARKDRVSVYLSVWSDYRGQTEVMQIMSEIDAVLHGQQLSLSTGRVVRIYVDGKDTNREPDGVTYMGQVRASVLVEH